MVKGRRRKTCGPVSKQGDAGNLETKSTSLNGFGDGRHADGVRPERTEHPDFGRSLILRTGNSRVNAMVKALTELFGRIHKRLPKLERVNHAHVMEVRTTSER